MPYSVWVLVKALWGQLDAKKVLVEDVWGLVRANEGHVSFVALKEL